MLFVKLFLVMNVEGRYAVEWMQTVLGRPRSAMQIRNAHTQRIEFCKMSITLGCCLVLASEAFRRISF